MNVIRRRTAFSLAAATCAAGIVVGLVGCDPFVEQMAGAGIVVVNETGDGIYFHHEGVVGRVDAGETRTLFFGSDHEQPDCATDVRVVTADGSAELWRDEICEDETWVIRSEDLEPVDP